MTAEPVWLLREFIIAVHERLIAEYGGSSGLRDEGLLESALARSLLHLGNGLALASGRQRPLARLQSLLSGPSQRRRRDDLSPLARGQG